MKLRLFIIETPQDEIIIQNIASALTSIIVNGSERGTLKRVNRPSNPRIDGTHGTVRRLLKSQGKESLLGHLDKQLGSVVIHTYRSDEGESGSTGGQYTTGHRIVEINLEVSDIPPYIFSALVHELRHALDDAKSKSKALDGDSQLQHASPDFLRSHAKASKLDYLTPQHEVNARFSELLSQGRLWLRKRPTATMNDFMQFIKNGMSEFHLSNIFPHSDASQWRNQQHGLPVRFDTNNPKIRQMIKRAYLFAQHQREINESTLLEGVKEELALHRLATQIHQWIKESTTINALGYAIPIDITSTIEQIVSGEFDGALPPGLKDTNIKVVYGKLPITNTGRYITNTNTILLNGDITISKSTVVHELKHAYDTIVQNRDLSADVIPHMKKIRKQRDFYTGHETVRELSQNLHIASENLEDAMQTIFGYLTLPHEVEARLSEVLFNVHNRIENGPRDVSQDFNVYKNMIINEMHTRRLLDVFPDADDEYHEIQRDGGGEHAPFSNPTFKRLMSRVYAFWREVYRRDEKLQRPLDTNKSKEHKIKKDTDEIKQTLDMFGIDPTKPMSDEDKKTLMDLGYKLNKSGKVYKMTEDDWDEAFA